MRDERHTLRGRARRARLIPAALLTGVLALASACAGPDPSLRVERTASPSNMELALPATEPSSDWATPFNEEQLLKALLGMKLSALPEAAEATEAPAHTQGGQAAEPIRLGPGQIEELLRHCNGHCLHISAPAVIEGTRLQLVSLTSAADGWGYVAFAVADEGGKPVVKLMVKGDDVVLQPGRGGTLVAQESMYLDDEPLCCPSGWSMRVFRWDGERFVGGKRIQGVRTTPSGESGEGQ